MRLIVILRFSMVMNDLRHFLPLISGISTPVATFLNLQSMTVPLLSDIQSFSLLSSISLLMGILGSTSIAIRMLELKIKAMTRIWIYSMAGQGVFGVLDLLVIHLRKLEADLEYTESFVLRLIASVMSILISLSVHYNTRLNCEQPYQWIVYDLSYDQRQFIMLYDSSLFYIALVSLMFQYLEGWTFEFSLYYMISTFTTIGFGDITPRTTVGIGLIIPISFAGVLLVGSCIYSLRNVILEIFQFYLVQKFTSLVQSDINSSLHTSSITNPEETPLLGENYVTQQMPQDPPSDSDLESHDFENESEYNQGSSYKSHSRQPTSDGILSPRIPSSIDDQSIQKKDNNQIGIEFRETTKTAEKLPQHRTRKLARATTLTLSRSNRLPVMEIVGNGGLEKCLILSTTKKAITRQAIIASCIVLANIIISGIVFSWLENWTILQGFYFAYCSFMTIGTLY